MLTRSLNEFREHFWTKYQTDENGCWVWKGAKTVIHSNYGGYGKLRWGGKFYLAHRMAWQLHHGIIPSPNKVVMHLCDNPPCVNPSHLRLASSAENNEDKVLKGRQNSKKVLSMDDISLINIRLSQGESSYKIAEDYPVTARAVRYHRRRITP